ncbi:conserved hypothetical protein [Histoplasma capsulatum H143]|uniref:Uncharacterized protein n=1 Tax=Ajellomyces capsulatus (strain H143) TaxID=544712 RepID=C6HGD7_AJECH|nr:conserved hypothetical protein [Histoplasma capsulatum H143]
MSERDERTEGHNPPVGQPLHTVGRWVQFRGFKDSNELNIRRFLSSLQRPTANLPGNPPANHSNTHLYHQICTFIIKFANMPRNTHCSTVSQACKRTPTTLHLHLLKLPVPDVPDIPDNDENSTDDEKKKEKKKKKETQSEDF